MLPNLILPGSHLANLLRVHDVVSLLAALSEDPAHLLHPAEYISWDYRELQKARDAQDSEIYL